MIEPAYAIIVGVALGGLGVVFGYIIAHKRNNKEK